MFRDRAKLFSPQSFGLLAGDGVLPGGCGGGGAAFSIRRSRIQWSGWTPRKGVPRARTLCGRGHTLETNPRESNKGYKIGTKYHGRVQQSTLIVEGRPARRRGRVARVLRGIGPLWRRRGRRRRP